MHSRRTHHALVNVTPIAHGPVSQKLVSLVSAALTPNAVEYKLQLSVLLKGARGAGKMTTIRTVARQLGMHVLEVSGAPSPHVREL